MKKEKKEVKNYEKGFHVTYSEFERIMKEFDELVLTLKLTKNDE